MGQPEVGNKSDLPRTAEALAEEQGSVVFSFRLTTVHKNCQRITYFTAKIGTPPDVAKYASVFFHLVYHLQQPGPVGEEFGIVDPAAQFRQLFLFSAHQLKKKMAKVKIGLFQVVGYLFVSL